MKNTLIACILFATVMNSMARSIITEDDDNGVLSSSSSGSKTSEHSDFLKITKAPPARVAQPFGSTIELECEAVGSPIPIVEWVHGSGRLSSVSILLSYSYNHLFISGLKREPQCKPEEIHITNNRFLFLQLDDFDANIISESDPTVMTTVRSRLIIDHQIASERTFTCVARSGSQIVKASTVVHKGPRPLVKSPEGISAIGGLRPVRITNYFKSVLALIGSNLVIPCKTTGRPRGEVAWYDNNDVAITGQEPRFKVSFNYLISIIIDYYLNLIDYYMI